MVKSDVEKAARHFVTQVCHVDFRQLLWTHDRKSKSEVNEDSDLVIIPGGMT
jgi:hypothetical protein